MAIIIKAVPADVPALNELVNNAYRGETSKKGWTSEAHLLDGQRVNEDILNLYINDAETTILKCINDAQQIIGCVYLKKEKTGLYLGMLTVNPELQAKGLGKLLLQHAEKYALQEGITHILMTVLSTRHELINWYERRGYKLTGLKQPFHADTAFGIPKQPLELLVLTKDLDQN
jgi:ribosomal protein S18 acetylase RimI-like enzyme